MGRIERRPLNTKISRRAFVVGSLAAGFALAVMPVSAETITTDSNGLVAGEVKIPVEGGEIPAYRAMPATGGPFPTVLVVHEIFGVHEHIKDICRRLAKLGYFAVAPLLYSREGAKSTGKAYTTKLGITGFCWGGRQVWLYAAHNPGVKAGVAWYGPLQIPTSDLRPKNPIDLASQINAPVLGLYGGADQGIPVAQIEQMRAALKVAGKKSEIVIYPDTPHGFNADYRPSYRPQAAKDGWKRLQAWFHQNGVA